MGVSEAIAAFEAKHGDRVVVGNRIVFQDGAYRELSPYGLLADPPQNEKLRLENVTLFWRTKLALAVDEFDSYKRSLLAQAKGQLQQRGNPGGPPADLSEVTGRLAELKAKAQGCQAKLEQAQAALAQVEAQRARPDIEQQNRAALQDFVENINRIEI